MAKVRLTRKNSQKTGCVTLYVSRDRCAKNCFYTYDRPKYVNGTWYAGDKGFGNFRVFSEQLKEMFGIEQICEEELVEINIDFRKQLFDSNDHLKIIPPRI